ncbi:prolyl oligopeptidase family serine peptidase [Erysipelothrix inopinata]|uniref:Prolyl oligopeptidase family serine peptidase n=1 Tax=Erysipelothrix inopinata TaxID=225084 RepID=A0A7G9RZ36_9FIRM|nr:alpha/beta hydrolase-fold protein [Erysipelothrix inopinata]QNN60861.1 prolyl oligopeptidase family serine peptidase [Erysipelothrix inopinata]
MSEIIATSMYSKNLKLDWNYSVYIPESWSDDSHLPVLCLFHGAYGNHTNVVDKGLAKEHLDRLNIQQIVVFVDGFNSFYFNGSGLNMESAILEDLIPMIQDKYHCNDELNLGGISMGGHGALRISLKHPDKFKNVFAIAPAVWYDVTDETVTSDWGLFRNDANEFDHGLWKATHPQSFLKDTSVNYYVEASTIDPVVPVENVQRFVSELKNHAKVSEHYYHDGEHNWDYFSVALGRGLTFIKEMETLSE